MTATEDCRVEECGRKMASHVWRMLPAVHTATRGSFMVSAGALEVTLVGRLMHFRNVRLQLLLLQHYIKLLQHYIIHITVTNCT